MSGYGQQEEELCGEIVRTPYRQEHGFMDVHELALLITQSVRPGVRAAETQMLGKISSGSWLVQITAEPQLVVDGSYGLIMSGLRHASSGDITAVEAALGTYGQLSTTLGNAVRI